MNKEERLRALAAKWRKIRLDDESMDGGWGSHGAKGGAEWKCADELEAALAESTPTRDPETCWHIFPVKQVGPLDGGPAKSTRYRCQECGTFLVMKPYKVEVTIGPKA